MFDRNIGEIVGAEGFVTWTYCNWGQRDMALNWWRHVDRAVPGARPLVFCVDERTRIWLDGQGVQTALIRLAYRVSDDALSFRSSVAWTRLTLVKVLLGHAILKAGVPMLYTDTDVVALRNPMTALLAHLTSCDIVFQDEHDGRICSGIIAARPAETTIELFDLGTVGLPEYELNHPHFGDQTFFKRRVAAMESRLRWTLTAPEEFPTGRIWYPGRAALRERALLVHYNWLPDAHEKAAEMRHDGVWLPPV